MILFYPYTSKNGLNPHEPRNDACLVGYLMRVISLTRTSYIPKLVMFYH